MMCINRNDAYVQDAPSTPPSGGVFGHFPSGGDQEDDPGDAGGTMSLCGLGAAPATQPQTKPLKMDGWMDVHKCLPSVKKTKTLLSKNKSNL